MSLNKISRTAGFLNYDVIDSDEENKPLKDTSYCIEYNDKITELCKNIMMPSGYIV